MPNEKCIACGKTVYPIEAISAIEKTWHKGCFKCQGEGCTVLLNLKTYTAHDGKIYCKKDVPAQKPTSVLDMATSNAKNAPKVSTVNQQVLLSYDMAKNSGSLSYSETNAKNAPKVATVNDQVRLDYEQAKNTQVLDMHHNNASTAPKPKVVNEQIRLDPELQKNTQSADMATLNAQNAPKLETVNNEVRVQDSTNSQVFF